jgi:DNA polymerase-3 subunit chi
VTQVDFYVLPENGSLTAHAAVGRIAEKALSRGHQTFVQVTDEATATALHDSLWTFREASFLPHALVGKDDGEPLVIGWGEPPLEHDDVLINITGAVPGHFARFGRLAQIVAPDAATIEASREAWRFYRDRVYPLAKHDLS